METCITICCLVSYYFYSMLQHQGFCTYSNGEYVEDGLLKLKKWCDKAEYEVRT